MWSGDMKTGKPEPAKLDTSQFSSTEQALNAIQRTNGFDDAVMPTLVELLKPGSNITTPAVVALGALSSARALYEGVDEMIRAENPQVVFTLIRQLAELFAVVSYTADNPAYANVLSGYSKGQKNVGQFVKH